MFKKIPFYFQNNFTEFLAISVLSGMMFYYSIVLLWPQPGINQETNISIPKGSTLIDVAAELVEKRVINNKLSFVLAVKILGYEKDLPAGKFKIVNAGTNYALIKQLLNSVGLSKKVTILEGWTIEDIAEKVSNSLKIDKNEFIDASTDIALLKKWDIENNSFEGCLLYKSPSPRDRG